LLFGSGSGGAAPPNLVQAAPVSGEMSCSGDSLAEAFREMPSMGSRGESETENWPAVSASGRQTPIAQRRPLQRICLNKETLSPAKRQKQSHQQESGQALDKLQDESVRRCLESPLRTESRPGNTWLEVFCRLGVRDLVDRVAPVCKLFREVAHSKELWALLRPHVRLVDQLLVCEKVVERRSKGRLFRCCRLGAGETVLLRVVDLELTNAGKDDGVPTSFLREVALLSRLRHPNIIRHFGAEVVGKRALMCTEYVHENFVAWFKRLEGVSSSERCMDVRGKFSSVLEGVSFIHHQGVMHRNLKPDNIFLDIDGTVRLGDFTTTRMLDVPFQAYTPEDPKERDRSGREMRRLWYRAPELILRDEVYGPKVDMWSVGCLFAEAATGRTPFQSESEIDHLFRVFRVIGTPSSVTWPEVVAMKNFSPKFPVYSGFNIPQVADAVCNGNSAILDSLMRQARPDRVEVLQNLVGVAGVLGQDGMAVLDHMLRVPPATRASADEALASQFFATVNRYQDCNQSCPAAPAVSDFAPAPMVWDILQGMKQREQEWMASIRDSSSSSGLPRLPPQFTVEQRTAILNYIAGMANAMNLTDYTLHLAASIFDTVLALQDYWKKDAPVAENRIQVVGATCLKIADVFAEQSKEYYKQENASEYEEASGHVAKVEDVLACEKELLPKLKFDLHIPTVNWFVRCYLTYARLNPQGAIAKTASFIADLTLLDYSLLIHSASLRAQVALVLAVFVVEQAKAKAQKKNPKKTLSTSGDVAMRYSDDVDSCLLVSLRHWDQDVRDKVCLGNLAVDCQLAVQAVVNTLVVNRREWKAINLDAVENRHAVAAREMKYPERFPIAKLVRYVLPDSQQGLLPH